MIYQIETSEREAQIEALKRTLWNLVAEWAERLDDPERQDKVIAQYHAILEDLYKLGWDDVPDFESQLPYELMPEFYRRLHPDYFANLYGRTSEISSSQTG